MDRGYIGHGLRGDQKMNKLKTIKTILLYWGLGVFVISGTIVFAYCMVNSSGWIAVNYPQLMIPICIAATGGLLGWAIYLLYGQGK